MNMIIAELQTVFQKVYKEFTIAFNASILGFVNITNINDMLSTVSLTLTIILALMSIWKAFKIKYHFRKIIRYFKEK